MIFSNLHVIVLSSSKSLLLHLPDRIARVSIAVQRHRGHDNSYKGNINRGGLQLRGLLCYCHGGMRADVVER